MRKKTSRRNIIKKHLKPVWKDLPEDILVTIFNKLDKKCLFKTAYSVCRWWRSISRLILYWTEKCEAKAIELSRFKNIGVDQGSQLMKLLKKILDDLEHKSQIVTRIELPEYINLSDDFLNYMAQRVASVAPPCAAGFCTSPKLIHLLLPGTAGVITTMGFSKAIRKWGEMKCLRMGPIKFLEDSHIFREIGVNCKNIELLDIYRHDMEVGVKNGQTFVLDEYSSLEIANNICGMKALVFERCVLYKMGLKNIMSKCKCLETIVIVHCKCASRIPKHDGLQAEYGNYTMTKRILKDNTIAWSMSIYSDKIHNSTSSILKYLWQFEEDVCDEATIL